jgi:peptidoglycan/xylan/chitin deacetylase (PgdA/CDA1 family)
LPRAVRTVRIVTLALIALAAGVAVASAAAEPGGATPGDMPTTPTGTTAPTGTATAPATPAAVAPLHLHAAALTQDGRALVLRLATSHAWTGATLAADGRSLCLRLVYKTTAFTSRDVCVARTGAGTTLTLSRVLPSGGHGPSHPLRARVRRPDGRSLLARIDPAAIGIPYAPLRWRVLSSIDGCAIATGATCFETLPPAGALLRLRVPLPTGCTAHGPAYVSNGSRRQHVVALTFDDGPWPDTPAFLSLLEHAHVPATFFMIGRQVAGHGGLLRRMLADGDAIGDHTWSHALVAGGGPYAASQIGATATAIQRASGFQPCLFRAPYGAVGPGLIATARGLGFTTIQWDVDPRDWSLPGTGAIEARVLGSVRNGSIVLMHDGGGPRGQTLAALPAIIGTLKARGYRFATVDQLTGATLRYG